jgi:hypothetical protein
MAEVWLVRTYGMRDTTVRTDDKHAIGERLGHDPKRLLLVMVGFAVRHRAQIVYM